MKPFKYYHGTSSIFLYSIMQSGLGAINPNIKYKNLELLQYLYDEAEKCLCNSEVYQKIRPSTFCMVNQIAMENTFENGQKKLLYFRHKNIFLALSELIAVRYAVINKYGSEILERCIFLYELLNKNDSKFKIPDEINLSQIEHLINSKPYPVLIEACDIDDNDLDKEDGKTAAEALNFLRNVLPSVTEKEKLELLAHCNFELLKPTSPQQLKFFKIIPRGSPRNPDFSYHLEEY
jgi:hypothetical protein